MGFFGSNECKECGREIQSDGYDILKGLKLCRNCYEKKNGKILNVSMKAKYSGGETGREPSGTFFNAHGGNLALTEDNLIFYRNRYRYTIKIPLNRIIFSLDEGIEQYTFKKSNIYNKMIIPYRDEDGLMQEPRFSISGGKTENWIKKLYDKVSKINKKSLLINGSRTKEDLIPKLDERLARGEISEETYYKVLERLEKRQKKEEKEEGGEKSEEEEKSEEVPEVVFYAQPQDFFTIKWDKLKEGKIEKTSLSRHRATDITIHAIKALRNVDTVKTFCGSGKILATGVGERELFLNAKGDSLKLNLVEVKYKGVWNQNSSNFYGNIRLWGDENKISEFVNALIRRIDYSPWEMDDWNEFTSDTGVPRKDVITTWNEYLTSDEGSEEKEDEIEEKSKKENEVRESRKSVGGCPNCGAKLEPDAEFCVQCGTRLERS